MAPVMQPLCADPPCAGAASSASTSVDDDAEIETPQESRDSLSDLSEQQQLKLQRLTDRRAKAFETLSNLMKKFSETDQAIIGNLK
jgi:hypothetical protein